MPHPQKHSRPGWMGSEQPDMVKMSLIIAEGLSYMTFKGSFQSKLFYVSMIHCCQKIMETALRPVGSRVGESGHNEEEFNGHKM